MKAIRTHFGHQWQPLLQGGASVCVFEFVWGRKELLEDAEDAH